MATGTDPRTTIDSPRAATGEMTLLEHLLELRSRVMWAAIWLVVGIALFVVPGLDLGFRTIEFLKEPAIDQNPDFRAQAITPLENIVTYFKVVMLGGLATFGMPAIIYQTLRFVGPALTPQEKRWIYPITAAASAFFVLGMAFAYYVVLPPAYAFLFDFGSEFADPNPTISSYMSLTLRMIFVLGLVFEMPVVVAGLTKLGMLTGRKLRRFWRFAIVLAFVASAIATPTPDPVTQTLVAGPILVLYVVSIGVAYLIRRN